MTPGRLLGPASIVVVMAVLGGCADPGQGEAGDPAGSGDSAPTATEPTAGSPSGSASPSRSPESGRSHSGTVVTTAGSEYGEMLFDRTGQAIYLFDKEGSRRPECYGACAAAWPPVLTKGEPRASGQAAADLLGTTRRRDGSRQVTYAGHPIYFYAHEGKNEVLCHDVSEYGGLWLVVTPSGEPAP